MRVAVAYVVLKLQQGRPHYFGGPTKVWTVLKFGKWSQSTGEFCYRNAHMEPGGEAFSEANNKASWKEELVIQHKEFPEGRSYSLNSKYIVTIQLQALAEILGLHGREACQLIEGKLMEMGHKPHNVQVVINKEWIFLVDDRGIITCVGHVSTIMDDHMNNDNQLPWSHHNDVDVCCTVIVEIILVMKVIMLESQWCMYSLFKQLSCYHKTQRCKYRGTEIMEM